MDRRVVMWQAAGVAALLLCLGCAESSVPLADGSVGDAGAADAGAAPPDGAIAGDAAVGPDGACPLQCQDRSCGPNGCGGTCEPGCNSGVEYCHEGQCVTRNRFSLGMFGGMGTLKHGADFCHDAHYETAPIDPESDKLSSQFTVLAEDGFDLFTNYMPGGWEASNTTQQYLELVKNVGAALGKTLRVMTNARMYFAPALSTSQARDDVYNLDAAHMIHTNPCAGGQATFHISKEYQGEPAGQPDFTYPNPMVGASSMALAANVYDNSFDSSPERNDPAFSCGTRPDFDYLFAEVYSSPALKDIVWGHQITEEASYRHFQDPWNRPIVWDHPCNEYIEVPPQNASDAMRHFKDILEDHAAGAQQMVVMEASHGRAINDSTVDCEWPFVCNASDPFNVHNSKDYVTMAGVTSALKADVFIDGSYYQFPANWLDSDYADIFNNGWHFLGRFKTIEWARQHVPVVHSDLNIENYPTAFHSNPAIENANYLWFQAYTSIIHGTKGLWFWELNSAWEGDKPADWGTRVDRFERQNFPTRYQKFVGFLARELRYLIARDLISSDANTVVISKTDAADGDGVLVENNVDLSSLSVADRAKFALHFENASFHVRDQYSVRYAMRTNGRDVVLIAANPLPLPVTARFDFSGVANPIVRASTSVDILFDDVVYAVASASYKIDRDAGVDLAAGTIERHVTLALNQSHQLQIAFGPMDVRVMKFLPAAPPPQTGNGWKRSWSNYGSGSIDGVGLAPNLSITPGNFRGTGGQELLTVASANSGAWATALHVFEGDWEWGWSNYGSGEIGAWTIRAGDRFVAGDFNGDAVDELLVYQPVAISAAAGLYRLSSSDWDTLWSNAAAHNYIADWVMQLGDKYIAGDFDKDGKDELLLVGAFDSGARASMYHFAGDAWQLGWTNSDVGSGPAGTIGGQDGWTIRAADDFYVADFDGDGARNDLLCVRRVAGLARLLHYDGNWTVLWQNAGNGMISGWGPIKSDDKILVGELDNDGRDEILFIQRCAGCGWATTMDFDGTEFVWRWSNQADINPPYIDDWPVSGDGGETADYCLVRPESIYHMNLLAQRRYPGGRTLLNQYRPLDGDY